MKDCNIPDQIIVTPFSIPQDFNLMEYKNQPLNKKKDKIENKKASNNEWKDVLSKIKKN